MNVAEEIHVFCWPPAAPAEEEAGTRGARRPESGGLLDDFLSEMAGVEAEFHRAWTARSDEGRLA